MEAPFQPFEPDDDLDEIKDNADKSSSLVGPTRIRDIPIKAIFPNLLTLLAICSGLTAIRFSVENRFELAIGAIVLAAILDGLDGRVARFLKSVTRFGAQMDSLADFVNFGVAPAMLLYFWTLSQAGNFGWICALIYVIGAGLRLARFNVMLENPDQPIWQKNFFLGVPAPAAALLVLLPVYIGQLGVSELRELPHISAIYALIIGLLMVSNLPTWSGKKMGQRIRRDLVFPLMIAGVLAVAFLLSNPWEALTVISVSYLIGLPFGVMAWRKQDQKWRTKLKLSDDSSD
ncbi:MAG: CDP-diacylglycerol--serine O-phosphatidyltransferase [Hyphomicrobiales bacterium]|nr:CDP-diacylglycerol--serine O-phosphatidyltransferase [Hyphomicrobiales bacterium]